MAEYRQNANWVEEEHPRDNEGKFISNGTNTKLFTRLASEKVTTKFDGTKMRLQLFAPKISEQSANELKKSRKSILARIEEHERKISNPKEVYSDWDNYSEELKQKKLNWWKKEIAGFRKSIEQIDDILRKK